MGIVSLVLGIISIVIVFIMPVIMLSTDIIIAIIGIVLGIISIVKKQQKAQSIIGIILSILAILLVVFALNSVFDDTNTSTTTSTNIETGKQQTTNNEELQKNIVVEAIGLTKNGDFAFKVINNNSQAVYFSTINVVFKDANGNFMEKAESQNQYFGVGANSEIINYAWGYDKDFSKYPNHEFETELASSYMSNEIVVDNFELTANNTGDQISVQVKNNNDVAFDDIVVLVAYYQNGELVGCENGYANQTTTSANGTAYINVHYPEDSNYDNVSFDDYKTYLITARK